MLCQNCGKEVLDGVSSCPYCHKSLSAIDLPNNVPENTSGQGSGAPLPIDIKGKWNWGAFLLTWLWGIGNRTWIALLCFIPTIGIIVTIILGFKGNQWAWEHKHWDGVDHFQKTQRRWAKWGLILNIIFVIFMLIPFLLLGMLATINPKEQINKAKDAQSRNNATEILTATQRYYVQKSYYPWNNGPGEADNSYSTFDLVSEPWVSNMVDAGDISPGFIDTIRRSTFLFLSKDVGRDSIAHVCYMPFSQTQKSGAKSSCLNGTTSKISPELCNPGTEYLCQP